MPYPLAHFRPFVTGDRQLVWQLQIEAGLKPELFLVRREGDQMMWSEAVDAFLDKVEFSPEEAIALRLRPLGRGSPL